MVYYTFAFLSIKYSIIPNKIIHKAPGKQIYWTIDQKWSNQNNNYPVNQEFNNKKDPNMGQFQTKSNL